MGSVGHFPTNNAHFYFELEISELFLIVVGFFLFNFFILFVVS